MKSIDRFEKTGATGTVRHMDFHLDALIGTQCGDGACGQNM